MWVLKLNLDSNKQFLGRIAIKHNISLAGYPLSCYKDKQNLYLISSGFMLGEEKNKEAFYKDLKSNPEIIKLERARDFAMIVMKQPLFAQALYDPQIIYLTPVIINPKTRKHVWNLASFNRKVLERVFKFAEKYSGAELIKFKDEKISNISFTRLIPELTKKQKKALEIAISHGYYNYPKKIKMEELAKKMKVAYSTFQAHLKKAESKILPEIYKEL